MKEYQTYRLFPTSVFHFELENYEKLNTELEKYIFDLKKQFKDVSCNESKNNKECH